MGRAAVITGLAAEVDTLKAALPEDQPSLAAFIACAAANPARASSLADSFIALGVKGLVSFGVCGGLDPALDPGTVVLPEEIVDRLGLAYPVSAPWREAIAVTLATENLTLKDGRLLGSDRAVPSRKEKAALHQDKGAAAVDMESHIVARLAAKAELPFLALRVVADPATRSLPSITHGLITDDGRSKSGLAALRLLLQPWQLPAMLALKKDYDTALGALALSAVVLGERLFETEGT